MVASIGRIIPDYSRRFEFMEAINSPEELVSAADKDSPWVRGEYRLRAESQAGQFPYRFSFTLAGDRYEFELTQGEVEELSKASDLPAAVRIAFALKISPIVRGRTNFY